MTCPLCTAPACDCPRELVEMARQAVDAQGLAIRPLLIKVVAQAREIASLKRERAEVLEAQRLGLAVKAGEATLLPPEGVGTLLGHADAWNTGCPRIPFRSYMIAAGAYDLYIDRGGRLIEHDIATPPTPSPLDRQETADLAERQAERIIALEYELAELRKPLGGELGEIQARAAEMTALYPSELAWTPAELDRQALLAEVHRLQAERDAVAVEVAAARTAIKEAGKEALARVRAKVEGLGRWTPEEGGQMFGETTGRWIRRSEVLSILSDEAGDKACSDAPPALMLAGGWTQHRPQARGLYEMSRPPRIRKDGEAPVWLIQVVTHVATGEWLGVYMETGESFFLGDEEEWGGALWRPRTPPADPFGKIASQTSAQTDGAAQEPAGEVSRG